ncbi:uncharacterized protein LOC121393708 isoform X2 [Xenopus laevis]|uniref:Uncharacterized protein LOC121393708 isoform X2 n=1 Tax=Xenopus laevis TaxID=8355 RepID=A0A8J1KNM3_XENLA|nr:uncharacterized protein LOC121393708 isoform X2 [Xenopus laevis]
MEANAAQGVEIGATKRKALMPRRFREETEGSAGDIARPKKRVSCSLQVRSRSASGGCGRRDGLVSEEEEASREREPDQDDVTSGSTNSAGPAVRKMKKFGGAQRIGEQHNKEHPRKRQWYNQRIPGWAVGQEFPYWDGYQVPSLHFRNREEEESWLQWRRERTQRQEEEAGPSTRREKEAYPANTRVQKEDTSTQRPIVAIAAKEAPMARCGSVVNILVIGHSFIFWAKKHAAGQQLGLPKEHMKLAWQGWRGMRWEQLKGRFYNALHRVNFVHLVIIHTGGNDLTSKKTPALIENMRADLSEMLENRKVGGLAWSDIIQRSNWRGAISPKGVEKARKKVNRAMHKFMCSFGKGIIRHDNIRSKQHQFFREDGVHLSSEGLDLFLGNIGSFIQEWWKSQEV